jgi:hypothetical protein
MKLVGLSVTRDRKSQPVYGNRSHKRKFCPRQGSPPTAVKVGGVTDSHFLLHGASVGKNHPSWKNLLPSHIVEEETETCQ